jgi:hypothetical protein
MGQGLHREAHRPSEIEADGNDELGRQTSLMGIHLLFSIRAKGEKSPHLGSARAA